MNVNTLVITKEQAEAKLDQYKSIVEKRRVAEDDHLQSLYASISKGARVLNLAAAFKQTGLNEKHQPKLAIARADWPDVHCFRNPSLPGWRSTSLTVGFGPKPRWNSEATAQNIVLPNGTFPDLAQIASPERVWRRWDSLKSAVPHIPPECRPKFGLHNYHILFEVEEWQTYPVDPFLLRRISGMLFVVEAEWDLTPLEAELLASMRGGN